MINGATPMPAGWAYVVWLGLVWAAAAILRARARSEARGFPFALAGVLAASVAAFALVSWGRATPFGDFNKAYYAAGSAILNDRSRLYACGAGNLCFVNLPIVAWLFAPLSLLPLRVAQVVFAAGGAAAIVAAGVTLVRETGATGWRRDALIACIGLNGPLLYSVRLGNLTHVLLPFVAIAFVCIVQGRDVSGGALLAALAILKPPFLLFVPYLIFRRRYRAVMTCAAVLAGAVSASLLMFGPDLNRLWLETFIGPFARGTVGAYNVQSMSGMFARLLQPGNLTNWNPLEATPVLVAVRYTASVVAAVAAALAISSRAGQMSSERTRVELEIVLVLMLLASPLTWTHYYAFCLIPLARIVGRVQGPRLVVTVGAAALISAPVVLALPRNATLRALTERVVLSHYVVGGILLFACLVTERLGPLPALPMATCLSSSPTSLRSFLSGRWPSTR